ncbi:hypothetical protein FQA47_005141 [Oryzias melastigma]|uniref:Uncharacterized protein n=1 Tax=Oryzias melastigma TaxID=30732 RepID=A0A834CQJ8_ORYME|nr:hypothetical protein FQA47_005141 [Oryzias melastigma]
MGRFLHGSEQPIPMICGLLKENNKEGESIKSKQKTGGKNDTHLMQHHSNEGCLYKIVQLHVGYRDNIPKTMQVTKRNNHNKHGTALIGMLHTLFCIFFTLHQSRSALRSTAALRVVMNSNQAGGDGKSQVYPVASLNQYFNIQRKPGSSGQEKGQKMGGYC